MNHTDYINYLNSVKAINNTNITNNTYSIDALTSNIAALNDQITQTEAQIQGYQDANSVLTNDNNIIDDIIALL